jgi:hypothetical protein
LHSFSPAVLNLIPLLDKLFSLMWECRDERETIKKCIHSIYNDANVEKRKWAWKEQFDKEQKEKEKSLLQQLDQKKANDKTQDLASLK